MQSRLPWLLAQAAAALAALLLRLASLLLALRAALVGAAPPTPPVPTPLPRACAPAPLPAPADAREAAFAAAAGDAYGYGGRLGALRAREFSRLRGTAYVDHAGAALFSELQLADVSRALSGTLLGNPRACTLPPCERTRTTHAHAHAHFSAAQPAAGNMLRRAVSAWRAARPLGSGGADMRDSLHAP
jgi:hypothetical protein